VTRRRRTPDQINRKLAEGQKLLAAGKTVEEVCRQFTIAESTWARWLNQYGGMKADDARKLKELEAENVRRKRLLAEVNCDRDIAETPCRGTLLWRRIRPPVTRAAKKDAVCTPAPRQTWNRCTDHAPHYRLLRQSPVNRPEAVDPGFQPRERFAGSG
jgi:transposase-like protein